MQLADGNQREGFAEPPARSSRARRTRRQSWVIAGAVLAGCGFLAACSSASSSASSSAQSAGQGSSSAQASTAASGATNANIPKLQAIVSAAEQVPAFTPPGPSINVSSLRGTKMVVMPSSSAISYCAGIASGVVSLGKSLGISVTNVPTAGQVSQWQSGALQAATLGAKSLGLICGIPPNVMSPQLNVLNAHSVSTVFDQAVDLGSPLGNPPMPTGTYATGIPQAKAMRILVDQAVVDHRGAPFHALILTSSDIYIEPGALAATEDELKTQCGPSCSYTVVNIPIADWGTRVQSSVASALASDPKIQAVLTLFDGMVEGALPAVESTHRSGLKIYAWGAGEGILKLEQTNADGAIAGDIGCGASWASYALMDQMLRVSAHQAPAPATAEYCKIRLFTPANVGQFFSPSGGFGTAYMTGYKNLWHS